jgi:predicted secreted protein
MALLSNGCSIALGDGASPEVFTALDEVIGISGPSESRPFIDVTALDDTSRAYIGGIEDHGELSINCHWDPDDTLGQVSARTRFTSQTENNWRILYTDSPVSTHTFGAIVVSWETDIAMDDSVKITIGLKISGAITLA